MKRANIICYIIYFGLLGLSGYLIDNPKIFAGCFAMILANWVDDRRREALSPDKEPK